MPQILEVTEGRGSVSSVDSRLTIEAVEHEETKQEEDGNGFFSETVIL